VEQTLVLGPKFSAKERKQINLRRFYAISQIEYCRNFIFERNFPIHKMFERSCELGLWRLTAEKISEICGTRMIWLMQVLLHAGIAVGGWSAQQLHDALLMSFGLSAKRYGLTQLRYDLRKMRAHALLERDGTRYAYRLTHKGVKVALLFVLFHQRRGSEPWTSDDRKVIAAKPSLCHGWTRHPGGCNILMRWRTWEFGHIEIGINFLVCAVRLSSSSTHFRTLLDSVIASY
jgi:hypothetical protein